MSDNSMGYGEEAPLIKEARPKSGLSIAGTKGVSLEPEDSADIRNRLLEMIKQREGERSGFGALMDRLAVSAQAPGTSFQSRLDAYNKNQIARNQDIFNMHLGVSQLDTENKRLAQARAEALQNQQMFDKQIGLGGQGVQGGEGEGGASEAKMSQTFNALSPQQQGVLRNMYRQNPVEAMKQLLALTKKTDAERDADAAGLVGDERQAFLRVKLGGSGAFIPHDVRTPEGTGQQTPLEAARPQGPLSATTAPAPAPMPAQAPAPAVTPEPKGALPTTSAPATGLINPETGGFYKTPAEVAKEINSDKTISPEYKASMIARYKEGYAIKLKEQKEQSANNARNPVRREGALPAPVTAPAPATNTAQEPTGFNPGTTQDLAIRQEREKAKIALEQKRKEMDIAVEQKRQEVPIAGDTEENKKLGEASAAEQTLHADSVRLAPSNMIVSKQLETDIKAIPGLIGKLGKNTLFSGVMNIADKGIQIGNFGSVSIPGLKDAIVQLDPEARKDPKKLEAYQRVINNISRIGLEFARAVNKGMGSMSNYERSIVEQAVGDPNRMSPNNLMLKAKALECDAKNTMEKDNLWKQMKKAKYSWSQFKDSPEYKDMERKQFFRTANAMRVPDAKYPGDQ
jgi:hypothetical protein